MPNASSSSSPQGPTPSTSDGAPSRPGAPAPGLAGASDEAARHRKNTFASRIADQIRGLHPVYFALVMATGITSDSALVLGHEGLATLLFMFNVIAYPWLMFATIARAMLYPRRLWSDLIDPRLVFTFFTIVAASNVFGFQLFRREYLLLATGLWIFALVLSTLLGYFSFAILTIGNSRSRADVIYGGWLVAIVGTESLVLLGVPLAPHLGALTPTVFVGVYVLWGIGVALYGIFATLFSYRLFFKRVRPGEMTPIFWVIMGAAAISTNAGCALLLNDPGMPFLRVLEPFVQGMTLIMWAWSSWWIPLLLLFGLWKYVIHREPLAYHPTLWSMVFPLGMYTMATYRFSLVTHFDALSLVPQITLWAAMVSWFATSAGALLAVWRVLTGTRQRHRQLAP
jgi:tellurite resistance protein TehA-like permease